jgi:hypothetical protein
MLGEMSMFTILFSVSIYFAVLYVNIFCTAYFVAYAVHCGAFARKFHLKTGKS